MLDQLPKITHSRLDLSGKAIEEMGFDCLDPNCTQKVKKLVLCINDPNHEVNSGLTVQGLISLLRFNWTSLVELNMWSNKLGAQGCKYLSRASLTNLETLDLGNNQIDSSGILHLCKASFGQITELDLSVNVINAESVHWLLKLNQNHLKKIWIRKNKIPLHEILKFVLSQREIAHLSVYENEVEQYSNCQLGKTLHQKFGNANITI